MPVRWPKFHNGYTEAIINSSGKIVDCYPVGRYPTTVSHDQVIGKFIDDIRQHIDGPYNYSILEEAIRKTIRFKESVQVVGDIRGWRRIGITLYIDNRHIMIRSFAPKLFY